jgi:hypothetical protein
LYSASAAACDLTNVLSKASAADTTSATALVATASGAAPDWSGPEDSSAITGYWRVLTYYQGSVVDERFDNWFADHNEVFVDETPPIEGNACNGTWIQSGPREFKLLHDTWQFDSTNTIVIAWAAVRDTITLSSDKQSFTGTETFTVYDLNNNVLAVYSGFNLSATRLKVDF